MNRGIARRTVFENQRDVRFFLSRLARAVRAGWIEVHAYCVRTTHFHLLVQSQDPGLSRTMQRVLNDVRRRSRPRGSGATSASSSRGSRVRCGPGGSRCMRTAS